MILGLLAFLSEILQCLLPICFVFSPPTGISIENGGGFLLEHGKIHEEALKMTSQDVRSKCFIDDFRSDVQSVSSPYPTQCPRPTDKDELQGKKPPQPRVSDLPTVIQPVGQDRTDASTATSGIESSSRGGYSSSDNTSSYPSRPSDEANSQSKSTLLNHHYFQPSDAICSFEDEEKYEPLKLLGSGDTTLRNTSDDLSYSSEDDGDDSFAAYSAFLKDDLFSTKDNFSDGEKSKAKVTMGESADAKRPMIDSAGFLVAPGDDNTGLDRSIRSESPANKTFASSTFNYIYDSESSVDDWIDVTRLTDEELDYIYETCCDGHGVTPLSFAKLVRQVGSGSNAIGNPYAEMTLFAQFSSDGHGGRGWLSKREFVRGVRRIEEEDGIESSLYQRLIQHVRDC